MKRMIVDTSNLLFRVAAVRSKYHDTGTPEEKAGLSMHMALNSLNKFYKKFKPDQIVLTFEGSKNWRKEYTKSEQCISKKLYKGNRVYDSSMEPFFELIKSFQDLAKNHSSLICLSNPLLEGDDLFAGFVQRFSNTSDEIIGISGDKDFVQLLKHKNFTLIDPDTGKPRTVEAVCGVDSVDYFMFEKAFRGDKSDNVFPAYPRVFKKRLLQCLADEYELTKIMNETWSETTESGEVITYRVGDLFEENNLLMNLECQPAHIKEEIIKTLDTGLGVHGKFSLFHFTKFCGAFSLKQIAENATQFAELFSASEQKAKNKKEALLQF